MKKVLIIMLHLNYGGTEKQTITLANELSTKYQVEIASIYNFGNKSAYELNKSIKINYLTNLKPNRVEINECIKNKKYISLVSEIFNSLKILFHRKYQTIKLIKNTKADIIISTRTEIGFLLSKYGNKKSIKITHEHNYVEEEKYYKKLAKKVKNINHIIVMTKSAKERYTKYIEENKIKIIPNMLNNISNQKSTIKNNTIIAVGRLEKIKRFDEAIHIFKEVSKVNNNLNMKIIGDGTERSKLEKLIRENKLENKIKLMGVLTSHQIEEEMLNSDLFLLTSERESFSLVILEANSCGVPAISYEIDSGPKEIIKNGINGYLIPNDDREAMKTKILTYFEKNNENISISSKEESKKYLSKNLIKKWEDLF